MRSQESSDTTRFLFHNTSIPSPEVGLNLTALSVSFSMASPMCFAFLVMGSNLSTQVKVPSGLVPLAALHACWPRYLSSCKSKGGPAFLERQTERNHDSQGLGGTGSLSTWRLEYKCSNFCSSRRNVVMRPEKNLFLTKGKGSFCEASAGVGVVPQCLFLWTFADDRNATMEPNGKMSLGASSGNLHGTKMLLDTRKDSWQQNGPIEAISSFFSYEEGIACRIVALRTTGRSSSS